jgi:hypothetical protein
MRVFAPLSTASCGARHRSAPASRASGRPLSGTTLELKDGRVERRLRLDIRTEGGATVDEVVAKVLAAR